MLIFYWWGQQTWLGIVWDRLKQGFRVKLLLPYASFCHLLSAADEDSRLNLQQMGSLGSTSLLQFLPELLGTLTEDNKAGEDSPQQFKGPCPWFGRAASRDSVPQLLGICWNTTSCVGNRQLSHSEPGSWAATLAAQYRLEKSSHYFSKSSLQERLLYAYYRWIATYGRIGLGGASRKNKIAQSFEKHQCLREVQNR